MCRENKLRSSEKALAALCSSFPQQDVLIQTIHNDFEMRVVLSVSINSTHHQKCNAHAPVSQFSTEKQALQRHSGNGNGTQRFWTQQAHTNEFSTQPAKIDLKIITSTKTDDFAQQQTGQKVSNAQCWQQQIGSHPGNQANFWAGVLSARY